MMGLVTHTLGDTVSHPTSSIAETGLSSPVTYVWNIHRTVGFTTLETCTDTLLLCTWVSVLQACMVSIFHSISWY